jgi:hypothetical protein
MNQGSDRRDVESFGTGGCTPQAIPLHPFRYRIGQILGNVLGRRVRILQSRTREVPVQVRVHAPFGIPAGLALATRFGETIWNRSFAEHQLSDPECEALFADAALALEEEARWKAAGLPRRGKASAQLAMSEEGAMRHAPI